MLTFETIARLVLGPVLGGLCAFTGLATLGTLVSLARDVGNFLASRRLDDGERAIDSFLAAMVFMLLTLLAGGLLAGVLLG